MGSLFGKKKPRAAAAATAAQRQLTPDEVAQVEQTVGQPPPAGGIVNKPRKRSRSVMGIETLGSR